MYLRAIMAIFASLVATSTVSGTPLKNLIVNGTTVPEGELPIFAELIDANGKNSGCGGTIIGRQTIVTAAHCLTHRIIGGVYLGGVESGKGQYFKVVKSVVHPEFNGPALVNDIAVVFLSDQVAGPYASFEGTTYPKGGSKLMVAGYGDISADGPSSPVLLKVRLTIGNKAECAANKNTDGLVFDPKSQVCATDNGNSACHGDSGGPLYSGSDKDVHVVGVVSGAGKADERCGEKGTYQYYTFIEAFTPWIKFEIEKFEKNGANSTAEIETGI